MKKAIWTLLLFPAVLLAQWTVGSRPFNSGAPVYHTFAWVQGNSATASGGSGFSFTMGAAPTAGHVVCVAIWVYNSPGGTITVTDGNGHAYTVSPSSPIAIQTTTIFLAYLTPVPNGASATINIAFQNGAGGYNAYSYDEFTVSGAGSAVFDGDASSSVSVGVSSPLILPSVPVTGANDLLYSVAWNTAPGPPTANSPWTANAAGVTYYGQGEAAYDLSATSNTPVNFTLGATGGGNGAEAIGMSFK